MTIPRHVTVANRIANRIGATHSHGYYWEGSYYLHIEDLQIRVSDHTDGGSGGYSHSRSLSDGCVDPYYDRSDVSVVIGRHSRIEHISEHVKEEIIKAIQSEVAASDARRDRSLRAAETRKAKRLAAYRGRGADIQAKSERQETVLRISGYKKAIEMLGDDHELVIRVRDIESMIKENRGGENKRKRKNLCRDRNRLQRRAIELAEIASSESLG